MGVFDSFHQRLEVAITFKSFEGRDGWTGELAETSEPDGFTDPSGEVKVETDPVTVAGIASRLSLGEPQSKRVTASGDGRITVFFTTAVRSQLLAFHVGDSFEVDGSFYTISKMDLRGVLPTAYKIRIEGVRS